MNSATSAGGSSVGNREGTVGVAHPMEARGLVLRANLYLTLLGIARISTGVHYLLRPYCVRSFRIDDQICVSFVKSMYAYPTVVSPLRALSNSISTTGIPATSPLLS